MSLTALRRTLLPALLLLALVAPATGQKPGTPAAPPPAAAAISAEIVAFGLFDLEVEETQPGQGGIGSQVVRDVRVLRQTDKIPGELGLHFGIQYVVRGGKPGQPLALRLVSIFPPAGLQPPGQPVVRQTSSEAVAEGGNTDPLYHGYSFDEAWEIVPGRWRFEVRAGDRLLAAQDFIVAAPAGKPN
jgi:hypothetical protein